LTWGELKAHCEHELELAGVDRPARTTLDWFDDVFGRASRRSNEEVLSANLNTAAAQLERLVLGEPLAYVTGIAHFYGYEVLVGPGVLIPRPETEELVRWILEKHPLRPDLKFADLCTGSGCIAVALALQRLTWRGVAVDISPYAIKIARVNVRKHDLLEQLDLLQSDLFGQALRKGSTYDLLVSNPPYIPSSDWHRVDDQVARYEPKLALEVSDDTPLRFYDRLLELGQQHLNPDGYLYMECNDRFVEAVAEKLRLGRWQEVEVFVDMQGRGRHVRAMRGE